MQKETSDILFSKRSDQLDPARHCLCMRVLHAGNTKLGKSSFDWWRLWSPRILRTFASITFAFLLRKNQSWAIGSWDRYSGIPVLPEVKISTDYLNTDLFTGIWKFFFICKNLWVFKGFLLFFKFFFFSTDIKIPTTDYRPFENSTDYLLPEVGRKKYRLPITGRNFWYRA